MDFVNMILRKIYTVIGWIFVAIAVLIFIGAVPEIGVAAVVRTCVFLIPGILLLYKGYKTKRTLRSSGCGGSLAEMIKKTDELFKEGEADPNTITTSSLNGVKQGNIDTVDCKKCGASNFSKRNTACRCEYCGQPLD